MQKDLHHVGTYVICRLAGMKSKCAEIVAYAAQQVDDATHGHVLRFTNGEVFRQTMTAHKVISTINFNVRDSLEVWVPFHFLPQGKNDLNLDGLITGIESSSLKLLKRELIRVGGEPLALYRLGIGLHCYADSFSHQDFKGFFDRYNNITLLNVKEGMSEFSIFKKILEYGKFYGRRIASRILPSIGHSQAITCPDIPYLKWAYHRGKMPYVKVDNLNQRFIIALESMYKFMVEYLERNPQFRGAVPSDNFTTLQSKFLQILRCEGSSTQRHKFWLECVHQNYFNFIDFDEVDVQLTYDSREWFKQAVETVRQFDWWPRWLLKNLKYSFYLFRKKENFNHSHWVNYMRAAARHRYNVIHEILPEAEVEVG